jgi:hypothetical protein
LKPRIPEPRKRKSDEFPMTADLCQEEGYCFVAEKNASMTRKTRRIRQVGSESQENARTAAAFGVMAVKSGRSVGVDCLKTI